MNINRLQTNVIHGLLYVTKEVAMTLKSLEITRFSYAHPTSNSYIFPSITRHANPPVTPYYVRPSTACFGLASSVLFLLARKRHDCRENI